ncbi:hypothetical protein NQ318_021203 [Aromia moschata]|uniref:Ribosomal protein S10 n=1 Tax=Aromia moschata TaxID=1265417 RepID=A0AAV8YGG8_9CUCU|nr:hypothetical protein NQ318_021203 [Aromia moschata]
MPVSRLDVYYRKFLLTKYFVKGWGSPENLQRLFDFRQKISNRETCYSLEVTRSDCKVIEGKFEKSVCITFTRIGI